MSLFWQNMAVAIIVGLALVAVVRRLLPRASTPKVISVNRLRNSAKALKGRGTSHSESDK